MSHGLSAIAVSYSPTASSNLLKLSSARALLKCSEQFDLLLAADVLYERVNLLPIVTAIDKLLKPDGAAYIADPRRRMAEQFLELAAENNF